MIVSLEKDLIPLKKWPQIFIKPGVKFNKRGIQRGSSSTLFKRMPHTQSPSAAFYITNELSSIYVHAVFAIQLSDANLLFLQIAPIALLFFKMIEKNWEIMCNDIESGTISRDVIIDDDVRQQINEEFEPDPGRAAELRSIFRRGMKNIVRRIWPEMAQLVFLASATYSAQTKIVKEEYARDVAISSNIHMATEGVYGIKAIHPIYPDDFEYVFLVNYQFFEFIHIVDIDEENPKTLLLHELKVNEKYELVITTREGLYRYRTQDIIKVTGYQDSTPQYQLLGRSGDVLNLRSEKVHVDMVIKALYYSANWSDLQIANYTCTENIHVENILGIGDLYYVIFVEFTTDIKMNDEQILQIDEVLSNHVENYKDNRKNGAIQAVKIEQVKIGTFDKLRNMQLENNPDCCFGQYKTPRILRRRDYLKFLLDLRIA
ncbi:hypothetical protein LOTGIDRAFT_138206 [Lottia gigantea]|uniref:GH3 auxin-responsive promoter n=1 Tax=Lottia gigantea TaxID=225164 RepID=V4AY97_LOTGI|nr:hypothetical protein LOTGIDRAFT_138206 [Lottia gigantea]ESP02548.1 hypothetical protein LOTGIDRAFT_138206 [Lottia gigantea]